MNDLYDQIKDHIRDHGHHILHVGPDGKNGVPPFSYSIGLSLAGQYEILAEKIPPDLAHYLINRVAADLPANRISIDHTCTVIGLVQGDMPIALIKTDDRIVHSDRTIHVPEVLGISDYGVLQLIIPDPSGLFPWEGGYDGSTGSQHIHRIENHTKAISNLMSESPLYVLSPDASGERHHSQHIH